MQAPPRDAVLLICTRDRFASLDRTLRSVEALELPEGFRARLRLVDNGSRHPVREWLAERGWSRPDLPVEVLEESRPGKSAALNRGLRDLGADLVAFTDDDMELEPGWLAAAVTRLGEDPGQALQGHIEVRTDTPLPSWFTPRCAHLVGGTPPLPDRCDLQALAGGNSFVPSAFLARAGSFREDLGPRGARVGYSEDVEWSGRLRRAGVPLRYCREAVNHHCLGSLRLRRRFFLRRQFDYSRTEVFLDAQRPPGSRRWETSRLGAELWGLGGALLRRRGVFRGLDYGLELAGRAGRVWGLLCRLRIRRDGAPVGPAPAGGPAGEAGRGPG